MGFLVRAVTCEHSFHELFKGGIPSVSMMGMSGSTDAIISLIHPRGQESWIRKSFGGFA